MVNIQLQVVLLTGFVVQRLASFRVAQVTTRHDMPLLMSSSLEKPKENAKLKFDLGKFSFSLLPLSPESVGRRKTIRTEIIPGKIWTFDQLQGIINVNVPVRCTVIKLETGGLFINNPVGPTAEYIEMIRELEGQHGPVKYITLSSLALEHKGTAGAFSGYFPQSEVFLQQGQYSFPINLPSALFFPFGKKLRDIPASSSDAPWGDEIEHEILGPLRPPGVGGFAETAFFHKATGTLLVTDTVVRVDDEPPAIIQDDPRALLYHARDNMFEEVQDSPENRRKGWRRMVLFGLTFQPSGIKVMDTLESIKALDRVSPEMKKLGEGAIPYDGGLYPWEWVESEVPNFRALQGGLLVAPILQKLILNREPEIVLAWADKVSKWPIQRIIPCHLSNNLKATGRDFRKAFEFLEETEKMRTSLFSLPFFTTSNSKQVSTGPKALEADAKLLSDASVTLTEQGVLYKEAPLVPRRK